MREMPENVKCVEETCSSLLSKHRKNVGEKSADNVNKTLAALDAVAKRNEIKTNDFNRFNLIKFDSGPNSRSADELSASFSIECKSSLESNTPQSTKSSQATNSKLFTISSSSNSSTTSSTENLSSTSSFAQNSDAIRQQSLMSLHSSSSSPSNLNLRTTQPIITINNVDANNQSICKPQTSDDSQATQETVRSIENKSIEIQQSEKPVNKQSSLLLRLFESKLFDPSMALVYLYRSKEIGVLNYIGNKLFQFDRNEVDFFMPQLVNLYINQIDICDSIRPYFIYRCKDSLAFSLTLIWLLDSFCVETKNCHPLMKRKCSGRKLCQQILSEELWYEKNEPIRSNSIKRFSELNCNKLLEIHDEKQIIETNNYLLKNSDSKTSLGNYLNVKKTHQRSYSETTNVFKSIPIQLQQLHPSNQSLGKVYNEKLGDLNSGLAFHNNCLCLNTRNAVINDLLKGGRKFKCTCGAPRLSAENSFIKSLINIGKSLLSLQSKELRIQRLIAELQLLNLNLPARVWSPLHENINHLILRIPPQAAILLNSKDKTPFLIFIEILKIEGDINLVTLPTKKNSLRQTRSEENLLIYEHQLNGRALFNFSTCKPDYPAQQEVTINASDIRRRLTNSSKATSCNSLNSDELEDSSVVVLNEMKIKQIKDTSPFGHLPGWSLLSVIVKCNDDLRQEMLAFQLLKTFKQIWELEMLPLWVRPYKILTISSDSGLIEPILNTISLSQIKKNTKMTLLEYFINEFGPTTSELFLNAQRAFVESLASYSIISYLIQLRDRHNGNILLDSQGHIIHIDYGYILSASPRNLGFESSPFKLTNEYLELMNGPDGDLYLYFKVLILKGMLVARKHQEKLISLVEVLQNSQLPCFKLGSNTIKSFKDRFLMSLTETQLQAHINRMVDDSVNSITTKLYDSYQYYSNNIL